MIPFLGLQAADDRHLVGHLRQPRKMLAESNPWNVGGRLFKFAPVGVPHLEIKGIHLRWTTGHPKDDQVLLAIIAGQSIRERHGPTASSRSQPSPSVDIPCSHLRRWSISQYLHGSWSSVRISSLSLRNPLLQVQRTTREKQLGSFPLPRIACHGYHESVDNWTLSRISWNSIWLKAQ